MNKPEPEIKRLRGDVEAHAFVESAVHYYGDDMKQHGTDIAALLAYADNLELQFKKPSVWKADQARLTTIAGLVDEEANSWRDGWIKPDGTWGKDDEWAHVRYKRLAKAAVWLRELSAWRARK